MPRIDNNLLLSLAINKRKYIEKGLSEHKETIEKLKRDLETHGNQGKS